MRNSSLYKELINYLKENLELLPDKPEETYDSSLSALWLMAGGQHVSAKEAQTKPLPELDEVQSQKLRYLIKRRIEGEPLAHITGRQQFMGVELLANGNALIPRKETEILGYAALKILKDLADRQKMITTFDLCCGAGNLAVALAVKVQEVFFYASDLSGKALELTRENVRLHNLENRIEVLQGSVFQAFKGMDLERKVDLIICNPPYISDAKVPNMAKEISQYEPDMAFNGGMLGLKVVTELIRKAPAYLKKGGWLTFEVGLGQGEFVKNLCLKTQFYDLVEEVRDNDGNVRVIKARK